mmetsp:Transcript_16461/g.22756  ORF Transcript_16461/g.22756 Transcript_16461/m.22756 type:complete len:341 (-) Transcript_16461:15-1037(-)
MDLSVHKIRTKQLTRLLKTKVGPDQYQVFKQKSLEYQRGLLSDDEYYAVALFIIEDVSTLREVFILLPDLSKRDRMLQMVESRTQEPVSTSFASLGKRQGGGKKMRAEVLEPGLVVLRQALSLEDQKWLVDQCFRVGEGTPEGGGFYKLEREEEESSAVASAGDVLRLNMGSRGRLVEHIDSFPQHFAQICQQCLEIGQGYDKSLTGMTPNTVLVNFYKDNAQFKWHRDSEDPNLVSEQLGKTIISLTVGLSAAFGYKHRFEDPEHSVVHLKSGDVLMFGGPARMIVHSVLRVIPKTMPVPLRGYMRNGRLNVTYRDVGCGCIDATQFPKYRIDYDVETK